MYIVVRRRLFVCAALMLGLLLCSCGSFQNTQHSKMGQRHKPQTRHRKLGRQKDMGRCSPRRGLRFR